MLQIESCNFIVMLIVLKKCNYCDNIEICGKGNNGDRGDIATLIRAIELATSGMHNSKQLKAITTKYFFRLPPIDIITYSLGSNLHVYTFKHKRASLISK